MNKVDCFTKNAYVTRKVLDNIEGRSSNSLNYAYYGLVAFLVTSLLTLLVLQICRPKHSGDLRPLFYVKTGVIATLFIVALLRYSYNHKRLKPEEVSTLIEQRKLHSKVEKFMEPYARDWSYGFYDVSLASLRPYFLAAFNKSQEEDATWAMAKILAIAVYGAIVIGTLVFMYKNSLTMDDIRGRFLFVTGRNYGKMLLMISFFSSMGQRMLLHAESRAMLMREHNRIQNHNSVELTALPQAEKPAA